MKLRKINWLETITLSAYLVFIAIAVLMVLMIARYQYLAGERAISDIEFTRVYIERVGK